MDMNRQVVFIDNFKPVVLEKTPYWKRPELAGRFHPNPYHSGKTPGLGFGHSFAALKTAVVRVLLFWMAPNPIAAIIMTLPIAVWLLSVFAGGGY